MKENYKKLILPVIALLLSIFTFIQSQTNKKRLDNLILKEEITRRDTNPDPSFYKEK